MQSSVVMPKHFNRLYVTLPDIFPLLYDLFRGPIFPCHPIYLPEHSHFYGNIASRLKDILRNERIRGTTESGGNRKESPGKEVEVVWACDEKR